MKIDHHQKRLNAIKLKYVFFPKKCMICREEYRKERMYRVDRWVVNQRVLECWYCQRCIHSKEELLNAPSFKKPTSFNEIFPLRTRSETIVFPVMWISLITVLRPSLITNVTKTPSGLFSTV